MEVPLPFNTSTMILSPLATMSLTPCFMLLYLSPFAQDQNLDLDISA